MRASARTAEDPRDPAEAFLAEAPLDPGGRLLILEGGTGLLLERFAEGRDRVVFHSSDYNDHKAATARCESRGIKGIQFHLGDLPRAEGGPPEDRWPGDLELPAGSFDQVLYRLGKGTAALHGALWSAWDLLRPGGSLFLAGHTREGVKSVAKRAEDHFGNVELLTLKSSCRLLRYRKTGTMPAKPIPDPLYFRPVSLVLDVPGLGPLPYLTKPGLFSYRATDPGTALLARHLGAMTGLRVLDLGCGSGVLGLASARLGAREVVATDSSAVAVAVARRNLADAGASARVLGTHFADGVEGKFDLVLSNPPFHRGMATDYSLPGRVLDAALLLLAPGGRLLLVANQFLDYPGEARGRFSNCEVLTRENGYCVFRFTP